jgi:hypothetical protein
LGLLQNLHCQRDAYFRNALLQIALANAKHWQNFFIFSHDHHQQVSADWVQQEKQNVGENFTFQDTSPFPREETPLKESALWIDSKFCADALRVE